MEPKKTFTVDSMRARFDRFPDKDFLCLLDGDNIRGKSGFRLSKEELFHRASVWCEAVGVRDKTVLFFDHGPMQYVHLPIDINNSIAVSFSGPGKTADDVIVNAAKWCQQKEQNVLVVTADAGLKGRCKQLFFPRAENKEIVSLDSETFVDMLDSLPATFFDEVFIQSEKGNDIADYLDDIDTSDVLRTKEGIDAQVALARREMSLRKQLHNLQSNLDRNKANNRNRKLKQQRSELQARLDRVSAAARISANTAVGDNNARTSNATAMQLVAAHLKAKAVSAQNGNTRRIEETWERVVLAERFHSDLLQRTNTTLLSQNVSASLTSVDHTINFENEHMISLESDPSSKQLKEYADFVNNRRLLN